MTTSMAPQSRNPFSRLEKDILSKLQALAEILQKGTRHRKYSDSLQILLTEGPGTPLSSLLSIASSGNIRDLHSCLEQDYRLCSLARRGTGVAPISRTRFLEGRRDSLSSLLQMAGEWSGSARSDNRLCNSAARPASFCGPMVGIS